MKRTINKINDDLIEICEYADPNVCFRKTVKYGTLYPDNYDFVVFKEVFNPFDLFNDSKVKDKKLKIYKSIIKEVREYIENNTLYEQDYDYDYEENLVEGLPSDEKAKQDLLEILDKVGGE